MAVQFSQCVGDIVCEGTFMYNYLVNQAAQLMFLWRLDALLFSLPFFVITFVMSCVFEVKKYKAKRIGQIIR